MSQSIWLALIFLPPGGAELSGIRPLELAAVPWTADELTGATRDVILRVKNPSEWDAARDVPELAWLFHALEVSPDMPRAEQVRLKRRLDYWLNESHDRLLRRLAILNKHRRESRARGSAAEESPLKSGDVAIGGGAAEARQVQQLIDLIEMTIQPDSWVNNGGRGSIGYYSPLHLLVIRNNQQVHREVGGLIGILGAQQ